MVPKFRCWDKPNKIMRFNDEIVIWGEKVYILDSRIKGYSCLSEHLMQSTGLKDKAGVDIYEGDVVEAEITLGHTDIGVVKFERGEFKVDDETEDILSFGFYYEFEVIGNIWEDAGLLEGEK